MKHGKVRVGLAGVSFNDQGISCLSSYSITMGQAMTNSPEITPNEADKLNRESLGRRATESATRG